MRLDSRTAIYCHELLHKKYAPNAFPGLQPDPLDPVIEAFKDLGFAHEKKVIARLKEVAAGFVEINQEKNSDEIERETVRALLDPGVQIIAGGYIREIAERELAAALGREFLPNIRASKPDLMVRIGVRADGAPAWAPVDIKSHKAIESNKSNKVFRSAISHPQPSLESAEFGRLDYNDLHQLAHYTRHFQGIGIHTDDLWVGIIGRDIEEIAWACLAEVVMGKAEGLFLEDHEEKFATAREVIRLSLIENEDLSQKSGVIPVNSSGKMGCTVCKYKSTCLQEMKEFDEGSGHVTLLARVTPLSATKHFPELQSIRQLLESDAKNEAMVAAQVRARVWNTGEPELLDPSEPVEIPEADIEIDIDLENSMEALRELELDEPMGEDRLYLYGYGIHDRTKDKDWRSAAIDTFFDYSNTEEGEYSVFSRMWMKLQEEITKAEIGGKSIKIFHYSPHEYSWWKKFAERHSHRGDVPTLSDLEVFKEKYLVDLYPIAQKYAFPTMSYSIKDLAKFAKFEWKVDAAGGANSLFKYRDAINQSLSQSERDAAIEWLDLYNRDDVRATFAVREFLRSLS